MDHPSALGMFEQMMSAAKGKHIVVFLDYDGTLSPILEDPERAYMSDTVPIDSLINISFLPLNDSYLFSCV